MSSQTSPLSRLPRNEKEFCIQFSDTISKRNGSVLLVGGIVRDHFLQINSHDIDLEVFGIPASDLQEILSTFGTVIEVGKSFGVFRVKGLDIDIALPRTEESTGNSHQEFLVKHDERLSFKTASLRRDFTINAIAHDIQSQEFIDPWGGIKDLEARYLRHVSPKFSEDPLRVLRAMQFIARFSLRAAPETVALCQELSATDLSAERIYQEWAKLLTKGISIKDGLEFLKEVGWTKYFPELHQLIDCPQDPEWHPEGDVWTHTAHCLDAFAKNRIDDSEEDLIVGFAVLCHDLGKPDTTFTDPDGRIRSPRHEPLGEAPTRSFLSSLRAPKHLIEAVVPLVKNHLRPRELYVQKASDAAVRRLAQRVGRIDRLLRVCRADQLGRPPLIVTEFPEESWLLQKARALAVIDAKPQPIILGRHLIEMGITPGVQFKEILNTCFEAQLEGEISHVAEGKAWVAKQLNNN